MLSSESWFIVTNMKTSQGSGELIRGLGEHIGYILLKLYYVIGFDSEKT